MHTDHDKGQATFGATVLLLDDDLDALEELREILELEDIVADAVSTIDEAYRILEKSPRIAVVVTDVHLVDSDGRASNGMDFVREATIRFQDRKLSFVVLSGDASAVSESIENGAVDFLTKPLIPETLIKAVEDATEAKRAPADMPEFLMRKVAETTKSLQQVTTDLAERERELNLSREDTTRKRLFDRKLRLGLEHGHVVPWFQPQVCVRTGKLTGFEALVRWEDPTDGVRNPADFLPLATEIGMIGALDSAVRRQAFDALASVQRQMGELCCIGINLTACQLAEPEFVDSLCMEIERAGLGLHSVSIEILESAMLDDAAADPIKANVNRLGQLGVGIELDDFGTGLTGLTGLRDLTVTRIKIDRSFVQNVHVRQKLQKFTRALIGLAKALEHRSARRGRGVQGRIRLACRRRL